MIVVRTLTMAIGIICLLTGAYIGLVLHEWSHANFFLLLATINLMKFQGDK